MQSPMVYTRLVNFQGDECTASEPRSRVYGEIELIKSDLKQVGFGDGKQTPI